MYVCMYVKWMTFCAPSRLKSHAFTVHVEPARRCGGSVRTDIDQWSPTLCSASVTALLPETGSDVIGRRQVA